MHAAVCLADDLTTVSVITLFCCLYGDLVVSMTTCRAVSVLTLLQVQELCEHLKIYCFVIKNETASKDNGLHHSNDS